MIEARIDLTEVSKIQHEVLFHIELRKVLAQAGIPFDGVLVTRGVKRGTMVWLKHEDLDNDTWVIRWYDEGEPMADKGLVVEETGRGPHFTWTRYRNPNAPAKAIEDDEL